MKILLILLLLLPLQINAQVSVSVPPQKYVVDKISDNVSVNVMAGKGADPHTFSPKPQQMKLLEDSKLYLAVGLPFEKSIKGAVYVDNGSHAWVSPKGMREIAEKTYVALKGVGLADDEKYKNFIAEIDAYDNKFKTLKKTTFLIYHPALGRFAQDYGMTQLAIEVDGKEPKVKELRDIIKTAKKSNVTVFLADPTEESASLISEELKLKITILNVLEEDWGAMMTEIYETFK